MSEWVDDEVIERTIDDVTSDIIHDGTYEASTPHDIGMISMLRVGDLSYVWELATAGGWNVGHD